VEIANHGGTKYQKFRAINDYVFREFVESMDHGLPVHDRDLEEWGLIYAEQVGARDFIGGHHWCVNFKRRNKIASRKVNCIVGVKKRLEVDKVKKAVEVFHDELKPLLLQTTCDQVYNTDQSGINMEMVDTRTLYQKGAKRVELVAQTISATTHSYSDQPLISADGKLHSPMLVCFNIGYTLADDTFNSYMAQFPNLRCVKSSSGKFSGRDMEMWLKDVFLPTAADGAVLILDEWSGYKAALKMPELKQRGINVKIIPAGATATEQPLDVGFNHEWKKYFRILTTRIRRQQPEFKLSYWKNLGLLLSLTLKQFSAPRFTDFLKYAFHKSHYYRDRPAPFETPSGFCFRSFEIGSKCQCGKLCFIRCAYCLNYLCYDHYITAIHNCNALYPSLA
jgi:hypothetical protein